MVAEESERRHRVNATNPGRLELQLSMEPGAPASLEEATDRLLRGEQVVKPAGPAPGSTPHGSRPADPS